MAQTRPYPRRPLEQALRIPQILREYNGGNPWAPAQIAGAIGVGAKTANYFYITTASRDYGLTTGTRDTSEIALTELGRQTVYPRTNEEERKSQLEAFLKVELFRRVLEHFGGNKLPERKFLDNTLQESFGLDAKFHDEFVDIFEKNCRFLGIGADFDLRGASPASDPKPGAPAPTFGATITVAAPEGAGDDVPICFVIMPFTERDEGHETGFFTEVFDQLLTPAATAAGFSVATARRPGSDVIQSTIVNDLLAADLVLADLTEHNPNVLFELGMRMHEDKPVALVRAKGTRPIFDVDNMLRVADYNPNLWKSTVERDVPRLTEHIKATWENRENEATFMGLLHRDDS